jgi:hypothetical protein
MGFLPNIVVKIGNSVIISDAQTKQDIVDLLINKYREESDNCIGEMLQVTEIQGFSVQDVVDIFAKVMYEIEDDELVQRQDVDTVNPNEIDRWRW